MADTSRQAIAAVLERLRAQAAALEADLIGVDGIQLVESDAMREAASLISALEAERDDALKLANRYAWERDKAREERDVAEYRSAAFWKPLNAKTVARAEAAEALNATLQAKLEKAAEALEWYGEQARLARLMHSGGDAGRHALQDDGGKRARSTLSTLRETTDGQT